jgi:transcriptional regulator of acetoin/glycerol metabolism
MGLEAYLDTVEKGLLEEVITEGNESLERLAMAFKVSRATMYRRLKKHGISKRVRC